MEYLQNISKIGSEIKRIPLYVLAGVVIPASGIFAAFDEDFRLEMVDLMVDKAMDGRRSKLCEMRLLLLSGNERREASQRIEEAYIDYKGEHNG